MSASAPTWLLVAVPAVCVCLMVLVVAWSLCRAAAMGDRLLDVPRDASGGLSPPGSPAHADLEDWDAEAELAGLRWDWER